MTRSAKLFLQILIFGCLIGQFGAVAAQGSEDGAEPRDPLIVAPLPTVIEIQGPVEDDGVGGMALTEEMDSLLVELLLQASSDELPPEERQDLADVGILIDGDRIQVQIAIAAAGRQAVTELVDALGGAVTGAGADERWLQGWLPILSLAD
ncbi:MAG: hypothetical protein KDD84_06735, partial [Caldilineaceae bacterium]|nr:hypothetical protein [Caldilineaceae bacterium]